MIHFCLTARSSVSSERKKNRRKRGHKNFHPAGRFTAAASLAIAVIIVVLFPDSSSYVTGMETHRQAAPYRRRWRRRRIGTWLPAEPRKRWEPPTRLNETEHIQRVILDLVGWFWGYPATPPRQNPYLWRELASRSTGRSSGALALLMLSRQSCAGQLKWLCLKSIFFLIQ